MSERYAQPSQEKTSGPRLGRRLVGATALAALATCPSAQAIPEATSQYQPPSINIVHDHNECPDDTQFGVLNVPGVGLSTVGEHAAAVSRDILDDDFDECSAGLVYGSEYNSYENTKQLAKFIDDNQIDTVLIYAHSFGGIAAVDMVSKYYDKYPDDDTKFAIAFFSSPDGSDSLPFFSRAMTQFHGNFPVNDSWIHVETYLSTAAQKNTVFFDEQTALAVVENAQNTPSSLVYTQSRRLLQGMGQLPENKDIPLYFIGDERDSVVDTVRAPEAIEQKTGKSIQEVIYMTYSDLLMSAHAGLWWRDYVEDNRRPVVTVTRLSLDALGARAKKPATMSSGSKLTAQPR